MAAVRGLRVSVESDAGLVGPSSGSEAEPDGDPEPMEVEEGELEAIPVQRTLGELIPDTSRRYENKAGTFITGIDVTSKEAVEKKEQRAKRFHFRAEVNLAQRNVVLDKEVMKKSIPRIRLEALYVCGVDEMSTQDIFGYFKEYPPAHIEWLDDTSCTVVWLDDVTSTRALLNLSMMPSVEKIGKEESNEKRTSHRIQKERHDDNSGDSTEEGEVEDKDSDVEEESEKKTENLSDSLSQAEQSSLLRNDLRPAIKPAKGNKLFLRFATKDDRKELGAARRSQYYMKYGNPNYGGMKGILSNSWKRRFHSRRLQRDVLKKRSFIGEEVGLTPPYKHRHSDLLNVPEEPIEEEEEDEDEDMDEDEDEDDRVVVEYREERPVKHVRDRIGVQGSSVSDSDSDEMDYDLELKMISTPSPKKSMKMTMYADEVESKLKSIRNSMRADTVTASNIKNRIGSKALLEKVGDVRLLLEEKRLSSAPRSPVTSTKTDVRQRLGKRPHTPERKRPHTPERRRPHSPERKRPHSPERKRPHSPSSKTRSRVSVVRREPVSDVHSRLGNPKQDVRGLYSDSRDKKSGSLWSRLGKVSGQKEKTDEKAEGSDSSHEDDDKELQRAWGAMIKKKELSRQKKSRLDNLPSLQIEISRCSSSGSDSES